MPIWLQPILGFVSQRFVHFIVYALIALLTIGIPYKLFVKDTNKTVIQAGGKVVNITAESGTPLLGCSLWRVKGKIIWQ